MTTSPALGEGGGPLLLASPAPGALPQEEERGAGTHLDPAGLWPLGDLRGGRAHPPLSLPLLCKGMAGQGPP